LAGDFATFYERQRLELVRTDEAHPSHPTKPNVRHVPATRLGDYEIVKSPEGFSSIRQITSGEVMHSVSRPSDEAERLYVDQSCLAQRLAPTDADEDEWIIWDVGLGAGSNAMAAVQRFESEFAARAGQIRRLQLVSFECDLDPLKLVLKHPGWFPHVRHGAPHELLKTGTWTHRSGRMIWELRMGDFLQTLAAAPQPDVIFFDPFSYKTDAALWTADTFSRVYQHCGSRPAELYTYSAATGARVALLSAGFSVAEGRGTGPKSDTTVAFTDLNAAKAHPLRPRLLGEDWLVRWRRSGSKFPASVPVQQRAAFERQIEAHVQFRQGVPEARPSTIS
jgi:queuine tRNA-ribosyltransferase